MRDAHVRSYARRRSRACIIYELGDVKGHDGRTLRTRPDPSMAVDNNNKMARIEPVALHYSTTCLKLSLTNGVTRQQICARGQLSHARLGESICSIGFTAPVN